MKLKYFTHSLCLLTLVSCHRILVAGTSNLMKLHTSSLKRVEQKYPQPMTPLKTIEQEHKINLFISISSHSLSLL